MFPNQAVCVACWNDRWPGQPSNTIAPGYRDEERCCYCGGWTLSGIYVRVDAARVPYPTSS